ncbi:uncharacterized protein LOC141640919 [Silene latifolia]|uniref:uncharacterized protein LOC141640919 n=1 Tax=Silene latifolia TaxID=37657 RepID=UPI003D78110B
MGKICDEPATIQGAFLDFYHSLLGSSDAVIPISQSVVQMGRCCNSDHQVLLMSPVTDQEINEVMFSIPVHKAAGPDGYTSAFFRDSWDIRLSEVLPHIISDNQGGFIKGRSIVENILICQDIIRMYNRKSVSPRFLLKVDLKKAYDSMSWSLLEEMMIALNFPGQFIGLVMVSVRTATYSLVLNGDMFDFFKGKKGLRQGDPLSPLLFTIAMEYLSRVLTYVKDTMKFKYHPLCAPLKLSHLIFADDLLLFSRGDVGSIMVLLRAFTTFSKASGLLMSPSKTSAYFNGVDAGVKQDILQVSGLVLVNSVLTVLYNYWVNIFIIPKGVLNRLNAICRSYLWDGSSELMRVPLVSWEKVCAPRTEGGLGIRDSCSWNVAAMGKRVWWIYCNPDKLWVNWGWKSVCRVRDKLSAGYQDGQWMLDAKGYTVSSGYELLRNKFQAVSWDKFVWSDWNVPKHSFVGWLIAREPLQVKAKLFALGISQDDQCLVCGSAGETHEHLFQQCPYSQRVLKMIADDVQVVLPAGALFAGIWNQVKSGVQQKMQRNRVRVEGSLLRPEVLIHQIRQMIKHRIKARLTHVYDRRDVDWLSRGGMNTKEKLQKIGYCTDDRCLLCDSMPETIDHLFSSCIYSCKVKHLLENWIGSNMPTVSHLAASVTDSVQWKTMAVILNAYHYAIWTQRNNARVNCCIFRPEKVMKQIEETAKGRIKLKLGQALVMARVDCLKFLGL